MARYDVKDNPFSSHAAVLAALGPGRGMRLLDVGCADGSMSARFADLGWNVVGIEPDETDAALAQGRGVDVRIGTLEEVLPKLEVTFDAVVLADVLEHLADPWAQLEAIGGICSTSAKVIISMPNVAHITVRAQLALGRFEYADKGIMDRTHLRFFTRRSAERLVTTSGLIVRASASTPAPIELLAPQLGNSFLGRRILKLNAGLAKWIPNWFAYQRVMICESSGRRAG